VNDSRRDALEAWLLTLPTLERFGLEPASGDASFRRYFRVSTPGATYIAMDAPPPEEDCLPFVRVLAWLESFGLNVPTLLASDIDNGFLLLSDLGTEPYLDALMSDPQRVEPLYADALDALATMQLSGTIVQDDLPPFDDAFIRRELALFHDWLCGTHLGFTWTRTREREWDAISRLLVERALAQPVVFVHRDYHSRNLMVTPDNNPGILDFQDAVAGPLTYDLVSLLKDCYVTWPADRVDAWVDSFYDRLDADIRAHIGRERFHVDFALMGVQRHLKAAGIFARLNHRDGKPRYMNDIPRTLTYVLAVGEAFPELGFLCRLIEDSVLPGLDRAS
jgi:aminoglycoside/choline kinase family phosphotransferase